MRGEADFFWDRCKARVNKKWRLLGFWGSGFHPGRSLFLEIATWKLI